MYKLQTIHTLTNKLRKGHDNFKLNDSGLHIHPEYPYLGATPDGLVECDCCGKGVVEIKCPCCKRGVSINDAAEDPKFCLEEKDGTLQLKRDHPYFYQIQGQMFMTNTLYSDFVIWTDDSEKLHVERISFHGEFIVDVLKGLTSFFKMRILQELVARRTLNPLTDSSENQVWCYCRSSGVTNDMIQCSNENCKIVKFHITCLGLKRKPKAPWNCLDCRKLCKHRK